MAELKTGTLTVQLHGFWHAGGGVAGAYGADAVVRKEDGLPIIPGRHLLGLLRHELKFMRRMAEDFKDAPMPAHLRKITDPIINTLFGVSGHDKTQGRYDSTPGVLFIDSAQLPQDWRDYAAGLKQQIAAANEDEKQVARQRFQDLVAPLYRRFGMTAIDDATGTAQNHTLRHLEVTVPLTLKARIGLDGVRYAQAVRRSSKTPEPAALVEAIETAASLVQYLGRHRTRGLGRARLSVAWEANA